MTDNYQVEILGFLLIYVKICLDKYYYNIYNVGVTNKERNMCKYETENGICEIAGILCNKVPLCTPETVYIDKEDENVKNNS